ncbi:MAG: septum formation initiator family protein [Candidatus Binatia bacterium]
MALLPPLPRKHKGILATCAVLLALLGVDAVYGEHGLAHLSRMRAEQGELERTAFELQQHNERLRERIRKLRTDDTYLEKLARERLGLVKKGEILYRLTPPSSRSR